MRKSSRAQHHLVRELHEEGVQRVDGDALRADPPDRVLHARQQAAEVVARPPRWSARRGTSEASTNAHFPSLAPTRAMSQPKLRMFWRMSSGESSKVTNTPGSPSPRMPLGEELRGEDVLALPAVPAMSVERWRGSPPSAMASKPRDARWGACRTPSRPAVSRHGSRLQSRFSRKDGSSARPCRTLSPSERSPVSRRAGAGLLDQRRRGEDPRLSAAPGSSTTSITSSLVAAAGRRSASRRRLPIARSDRGDWPAT